MIKDNQKYQIIRSTDACHLGFKKLDNLEEESKENDQTLSKSEQKINQQEHKQDTIKLNQIKIDHISNSQMQKNNQIVELMKIQMEENKLQKKQSPFNSKLKNDNSQDSQVYMFNNNLNSDDDKKDSSSQIKQYFEKSLINQNDDDQLFKENQQLSQKQEYHINQKQEDKLCKEQLEEDEEEQQLLKSVSQVFQKDDQNQIKNVFDFFKSNREGKIFNRSKIKKEKFQKSIKISTYRYEQESYLKKYVLFQIETVEDGKKFIVDRRYNNFRDLHNYFENSVDYYGIIKPTLPSKNLSSLGSYLGSNFMDGQILEQRKIDLENYLNLQLQNDFIKNDKVLKCFLEEKEFNAPVETQFSYMEWIKKTFQNIQATDLVELKEYTEAKMKITLSEFFKMGDNEMDTKEIDSLVIEIQTISNLLSKIINFLNEDLRFDTEQQINIQQLENNFYLEQNQIDIYNCVISETLERFKTEALDISSIIGDEILEKNKIIQQFKIIRNQIESAMAAQQVLKNKIQEHYILKKIKIAKYNKVHEQYNNKRKVAEAKRDLDKIEEKIQNSEVIIKQIQDKLQKELQQFIDKQNERIALSLQQISQQRIQYLEKKIDQ